MLWWKQDPRSLARRFAAMVLSTVPTVLWPLAAGAEPSGAIAPSMPLAGTSLPDAAPGECYAEVTLPARTLTEPFDLVLREAAHRFEITPAEWQTRMQAVVVEDAHTRITAIQPEMRSEPHRVELVPAGSRWVRESLQGQIPLSDGEKADLLDAGIHLDRIPVGVCLREYWREPVMQHRPLRVLTREATERLNVIPATFREHPTHVLLRPAVDRLIEIPAVYTDEEVPVLMEAAHAVWIPGSGPLQRSDAQTGEILCRVDRPAVFDRVTRAVVEQPAMTTRVREPAEYHTLSVRRLDTDAQTTRSAIPAEFATLEKPVLESPGEFLWQASTRVDVDDPGTPTGRQVCHQAVAAVSVDYTREVVERAGMFERERVPDRTVSIEVQTLMHPAVAEKVEIPAVTETRQRVIGEEPAQRIWQPVLCETNITAPVVKRLQQALLDKGFDPGTVDGVFGEATRAALDAYQQSRQLAQGELTLETLDGLGVHLAIAPD